MRPLRRLAKSRPLLWVVLLLLLLTLLGVLAYLARSYEDSSQQLELEQVTATMASDLRAGLGRQIQDLQSMMVLNAQDPTHRWMEDFTARHREVFALEARDLAFRPLHTVTSPFHAEAAPSREDALSNVRQACANAVRYGEAGYAPSHFWPMTQGIGHELMEMCLPVQFAQRQHGYLVVTYRLTGLLGELIRPELLQDRLVALTESDGTRLTILGRPVSRMKVLHSAQVFDLPGAAYVLRVEQSRAAQGWFPNVLSASVAVLALSLLAVLWLLARDVRKRQEAERQLATSLAFRQAMEDSLVIGLRACDMDGHLTHVNPAFCRMVGMSAEQLLGAGMPAPYWPPGVAQEYEHRRRLRAADPVGLTVDFESELMHTDGRIVPVRIFESPLLDKAGQQTGWVSTLLDVSEQRRMEELTRTSQERLQATARLAMAGEMASLISHELNQPLAAISSYANGSLNLLPAHRSPDPETVQDIRTAMQRMADEATRAGKVIKSVGDLVRRRDHARQVVPVHTLLDAIAPLVRLRARKESVEIRQEVVPDCPPVWCDRTMIEQVLLNLARNGLQAMQGHEPPVSNGLRVLTMTARPVPDEHPGGRQWVEFSVEDHGHGLSSEVERQLFTPFFTTKAEGMGLGLSMCRTVVEQHGGRLRHAPASPSGTVFYFTLPVAADAPPAAA